MNIDLSPSWSSVLAEELRQPSFPTLTDFVDVERTKHEVFPPEEDVFAAFRWTPYEQTKVLILGQDPYHDKGQAHGFCFSVRPGVALPPSLKNIYQELGTDVGALSPGHGCLLPWAQQGVLLLNAVLTVRAHQANSHKGKGWEAFTDGIIRKVNDKVEPVVFVLWGGFARKKSRYINNPIHTVLEGVHPSPLSAHQGFFGSRPFSAVNDALRRNGETPIKWQLPDREQLPIQPFELQAAHGTWQGLSRGVPRVAVVDVVSKLSPGALFYKGAPAFRLGFGVQQRQPRSFPGCCGEQVFLRKFVHLIIYRKHFSSFKGLFQKSIPIVAPLRMAIMERMPRKVVNTRYLFISIGMASESFMSNLLAVGGGTRSIVSRNSQHLPCRSFEDHLLREKFPGCRKKPSDD